MELDDADVYSWKEYTVTGVKQSSPVESIDLEYAAFGGMRPESWQGSFSCCTTTLCSDCTIG